MSDYRPPRWLKGGHAQTVWPSIGIRLPLPAYRRERWTTPDGDELAVDFIDGRLSAPQVVLFHGLEGSSASSYAKALMHEVRRRGWNGAVPHFRGCGGHPNRKRRAYHAGDSAEIAWMLERFAQDGRPLFAAGISLGGNMLLKHLGEYGERALPLAAAAVSVPLDLTAASLRLDAGLAKHLYTRYFLSTLKPKALAQLQAHPGLFDRQALLKARTFREFDRLVTAPLHGFRDEHDYWQRSSSKPYLAAIRRPTLVLNARNDPFLPAEALPGLHEAGPAVTLEQPAEGGHAGFVAGAFPGRLDWLPQRLLGFFEDQASPEQYNPLHRDPSHHVRYPEHHPRHQA
jgi:predicted alpha/beta-fold hydrolase